ncbi:TolC family protein [Larkinella soli]|uniref:TolC family protein n=1 Tax=Larkinella soli TaxID=1770527 RepID=UPI000FFC34B3|nr:TolC family protein [Larkinella soli]
MKKLMSIGLLSALLLPLGSRAQAPADWSLKACIDYGLKNFGTVRVAQYQKEVAHQQAREAVSGYLPQVNGSGSLDDNIKLQTTVLPAGFAGPEPLRIALGSKFQTSVSASVDQPIFDKTLLLGLKANKPNQERADLNERQTREDVIYSISSNYYQVLVAQEQIALLKDNLNQTEQVLNVLKLQRDNGVIQPVDFDRTEVNYNSTKSQLTLAENSLNLALNRLKFQMGMPQDQNLMVSDSLMQSRLPAIETNGFEARNLTSFRLSENELTLQRLNLQRTQAGYLPKLSLNARYGSLALGNELGPSLNRFVGFGSVGLRLTVPIFDGFKRDAQIQQSKLNVQTLQEQQRLNVASYQLQFNNAQTQLQKSQTQVQNDDRNVKLALKVYEVTTLQYKQGTKPLTDLINAETSYRQAQTNFVNSLINFYQARLDLEQSQGTLLNFYNQL